jgi:D-alanine-D-alanine ligase-like ATP-grasp enzyme
VPETPLIIQLWERLCEERGATLLWDEANRHCGGIVVFADGRQQPFRARELGINLAGPSTLVNNKAATAFVLAALGYSVPEGRLFPVADGEQQGEALAYARSLGWPVIVKPNDRALGRGVSKVEVEEEFAAAWAAVRDFDADVLVQRWYAGGDYRVVVFDDDIVAAYLRSPPELVGDGVRTLAELCADYDRRLVENERSTLLDPNDPSVRRTLIHQGLALDSVPAAGRVVTLLPNANLSMGGSAVDVTERLHPEWRALCLGIRRSLGMRLCGLDLLAGDVTGPLGPHVVLEVNRIPGMAHYASLGPVQRRRVDDVYRRLLQEIERPQLERPSPELRA